MRWATATRCRASSVSHHRARYLHASFLFLSLVACAFSAGCNNHPADYVRLLKLPREQQPCEFRKLPIDKQIEFYLYSSSGEPPRPKFDVALASQGRTVVPQLLQRLRNEPAEYRQLDLILLFELMNSRYVDLKNDKEVIGTIQEVVAKMKDPDWKRMAEKSLAAINERSRMLPPTNDLSPCDPPVAGS